jgi:hypothetical protein
MGTTVKHRCADHMIDPSTETLIIGTFNPDKDNRADFFYGRGRNYLWTILPKVFDEISLKGKAKEEKLRFIRAKHIDFVDLIWEIEGEPQDFSDKYLDKLAEEGRVRWREDIIQQITKLRLLKRVCVSRKRFDDVRNIKGQVEKVAAYFRDNQDKKIAFECLVSPARYYSDDKQREWSNFFNRQ